MSEFKYFMKTECPQVVSCMHRWMDLLNVTEDSSLCNSTPMNLLSARDRLCLEREERATARLQHRRKETRSEEDQSRPK